MKKTSLSRLAVILFTAAIAAVNIPVIAQPQNNRLDSLKRKYSYEVCKEYLSLVNSSFQTPDVVHTHQFSGTFSATRRSYYITKYTIPIMRVFPDYFEHKTPDIFPRYTYFTPNHGCPMYVTPKKTTNISGQLDSCRTKLDSISNRIIEIMYADSIYISLANYIKDPATDTDKNNIRDLLVLEERRIRQNHLRIIYVKPSRRVIKHKRYYQNTGTSVIIQPGPPGFSPDIRRINLTGLEYRHSVRHVSYIEDYLNILYHTNNCCLALILDDHIRRGVPIDISWIPEQTLAEIEATKPVHQLKKQIKALEKQQKQ